MAKRKTTGLRKRHSRTCRSRDRAACNCSGSWEASVYSKRDGKKIRRSFPTEAAARGWRADAGSALRKGGLRSAPAGTLRDAWTAWIDATERGEILSRHRRPYKPSTLRGYKAAMNDHVLPDLGALRLGDLTADDFQALVDRLVGTGSSGSTVRNALVPCQALYRKHRRQVLVDPTSELDLPEPSGRRERIAEPK
jgi:integrase